MTRLPVTRRRGTWTTVLVLALALTAVSTRAGRVTVVDPTRVSVDAVLNLTGTGLDGSASNNSVTFTPDAGPAVTTSAFAVGGADATGTLRRISVRVPRGLPVGRSAVRITNLASGEHTDAGFVEVVGLSVSPASGLVGSAPFDIVVKVSPNGRFLAGSTRLALGPGVGASNVRVTSATDLTATVTIAGNAAPGPRTLTALVSGQSAQLTDGFTVLPADGGGSANRPPTFTSVAPSGATVGTPYAYTATASDPDGDAVQFFLVSGPAGFAMAPSGAVSWTPTAGQTGAQAVTIEARDGQGGVTPQSFTVAVSAVPPTNTAPTFTSVAPSAATVGTPYAYTATASDPDGDPVQFFLVSGPAGLSIAPNGVVSWTPAANQVGAQAVTIEARDGQGGVTPQSFTVTVSAAAPTNTAPTFTSVAPGAATVGTPYAYTATASDPDGDAVQFFLVSGPAGFAMAPSGAVTWTPGAGQVGAQAVTIEARDGQGGVTPQSFTVTVSAAAPTNTAPTFTSVAPGAATVGTPYAYTATASDPDGDAVQFFLVSGPAGFAMAPSGAVTWTPGAGQVGAQAVTIEARDGQGGVTPQSFTVTVSAAAPTNTAPVVSAGEDQVVTLPATGAVTATLAGSVTDDGLPQGAALTIAWSVVSGPAPVFFASPAAAATTASFTLAGSYVLRLTAGDSDQSALDEVTVTVNPPATEPNAAPSVDITDLAGQVTLPAAASLVAQVQDDGKPVPPGALTLLWEKVAGPGSVTFTALTAAQTSASFGEPGSYTLRLTASDGSLSSSDTVVVDVVAPAPTNAPPTVDAGPDVSGAVGDAVALAGASTHDGKPGPTLSLAWTKVSGPGTVTFGDAAQAQTTAAFTGAGTYVLQLSASDGEFAVADTVAATIVAAADATVDRAPPIVTLVAPREAVPGATVTLRAEASDNVGVAAVQFAVDGTPAAPDTQAPFTSSFTVPDVAAPGTTIAIAATARDAAGNEGGASAVLTISAAPDTEPPLVQIGGPVATAPGASLRLTATASDNVGVASVTFLVGGAEVGTGAAAPYQATHLVPVGAVGPLAVVARATDFAGNSSESVIQVAVDPTPDATPPVVTLDAPVETFPGAVIELSATASDAGGIASVGFALDGAELATVLAPPFTTTYRVPVAQPPGSTLEVIATATDFAALTATAPQQVRVVAAPLSTRGVVTGEVYDEGTGLPLAGARVSLEGEDATGGRFADETTTDARGRYLVRGAEGEGRLVITKEGFTRVDRTVTLVGAQAVEALDARLTQVETLPGRVGLAPASGALPSGLRLVSVSGQGLLGRLPLGWSPVGAVDVWPHAAALGGPATLRAGNRASVSAATPISVARFDEAAGAWRVVASGRVSQDGLWLEATISASGQHVFLVADAVPVAPPAAVVGQLLAGVDTAELPADVTTAISPEPQVLFYEPDVFSEVQGLITGPAPLSSGVAIQARVGESYRFASGAELQPEPYVADLVFYQVRGASAQVAAAFVVSPSQRFDPLALERGVITVELIAGGDGPAPRGLVTSAGGVVDGPGGLQLVLPAGAVSDPTPIDLSPLASSPVALPDALAFVAGVEVNTLGALARGGRLSMPVPAGLGDASRVVLARVAPIAGQTRLVLAGVARLEGGRLVADTAVAGQATALEGVLQAGQYVFLRVDGAIGFAGGLVRGTTGTAFAGALVTSDTLPVVSLSTPLGGYLAVGRAGTNLFTARDLVRNDAGGASTFLTAGQLLGLGLQVVAQPPRVTSIAPADGATGILLGSPIVVSFSEPVDPSSVAGANVANVTVTPEGGEPVSGTAGLSGDNAVLTFRPSAALAPNTRYTVRVGTGIADVAGYALAAPATASFETLDTTPPPTPPAGAITASIPDAQGRVSVSATQGTAGPADRVFVDNLTRKTTAVALVNANGSFSTVIAAGLTDTLRVRIVDASGNETVQELTEFKQVNADGSVSQVVGPDGGVVEGPGGSRATIRPGTFPQGAVVTLRAVAASAISVTFTSRQAEEFSVSGGVAIDFGGVRPQQYVDLAIAPTGGETPRDRWMVGQVRDLDGRTVLNVVDTGSLKDGRITTASPPCPGVTAAGTYGFLKARQQVGVNYAQAFPNGGQLAAKMFSQIGLFLSGAAINSAIGIITEISELAPFASDLVVGSFLPEMDLPLISIMEDLEIRERQQPCFPVLTGDVNVSDNVVRFRIPGGELAPADRLVIVTKTGTEEQRLFPRDVPEFRFRFPGKPSNTYTLSASGGGDPIPLKAFTIVAIDATTAELRISPDAIATPITAFVLTSLKEKKSFTFAVDPADVDVSVPGGAGDSFFTTVQNARGERRLVPMLPLPNDQGAGNLVVRARQASIDPTRAEMDAAGVTGPARTKVVLANDRGLLMEIPAERIVLGGFAHAFDGDPEANYSLIIMYDTRPPYSFGVSRFRIEVTSTRTGKVLKTIKAHAPPRDEPLLLEPISNDLTKPIVVSGPVQTQNFDPASPITFRFSEPMDAATVKDNFLVVDSRGEVVAGTVRISSGNREATFVPDVALRANDTYTVTLKGKEISGDVTTADVAGMLDAGGNPIATLRMEIRTFVPRRVGRFPSQDPIKDVVVQRKKVVENEVERTRTYLYATTGAQAENFITIDATDAGMPLKVGGMVGQASRQRVTLLPDVSLTRRDGTPLQGDLAITTRFNVNSGSVHFLDVTSPQAPVEIGGKVLTINPDLALPGYERTSTVFATAYAKGVAAVATGAGAVAYAAVERFGIMATDVADNSPLRPQGQRVIEGTYTCDAMDVATLNAMVVGLCRDGNRLVTLDAALGTLGQMGLPGLPRRIRVVEDYVSDLDADGRIDAEERFTLAVVGGDQGIFVVDLRQPTAPTLLTTIPIAGTVRDVEVDAERRRIFAGADLAGDGPTILMYDLSSPAGATVAPGSEDPRLLWSTTYAAGFNGVRLDPARGLLYVAQPAGLDIYAVYDACCDVRIDMRPVPSIEQDEGDRAELLRAEQKALQQGIAKGLNLAVSTCNLDPRKVRILESGSSACIWDPDPAKTCTKNYQPGVSDHDLSMFFTSDLYRQLVTRPQPLSDSDLPEGSAARSDVSDACKPTMDLSKPADRAIAAAQWSVAVCTIQQLTDQFTDAEGNPIAYDINGTKVRFEDISFLPNNLDDYMSGRYNLCATDPNIPGDGVNDMALGRQLLVMKHVTEARWIDIPGWGGDDPAHPERDVVERTRTIEDQFTALREVNPPPVVEGYEWANLMEWQFALGKGVLRIPGASDENSQFHHLFIAQLHKSGKAGIRAAMARMIADPLAGKRAVGLGRAQVDPGSADSLAMDVNACLFYMPAVDPRFWPAKPCDSLEEWIASAAARTLRPWKDQPPLTLFSEEDIQLIHRFYRIKSDQELITTDDEATRFIAQTADFINRVLAETKPAYDAAMASPDMDPQERKQRESNLRLKEEELEKQLRKKLIINPVPRISNAAFKDVNGVLVKMYHNGAPATKKGKAADGSTIQTPLETRLDLSGGDRTYLAYERDENGFEVRDGKGRRTKFFEIGPIDHDEDPRVMKTVSFVIDLPEKKVDEASRIDNVTGFFYWLIDRKNPIEKDDPTPPAYSEDQLIPPGVGSLAGDATCDIGGELEVTQSMVARETLYGGPPVVLSIGELATLRTTVRNTGDDEAPATVLCSSLTNTCQEVGALGPGESRTITAPFSSDDQVIVDAVPSAYALNRGISVGEPFRVVVACEPFAVVQFSPDPNPFGRRSEVMAGGTVVRHYQVIDRTTGKPIGGAAVRVTLSGAMSGTFTFTTNADGVVGVGAGDGFAPGVAIPVPTGTSGEFEAVIEGVNALPVTCAVAPKRFSVTVRPFELSETFEAGGALQAGFKIFGPREKKNENNPQEPLFGGEVRLGGSVVLRLHRRPQGLFALSEIDRFDWERTTKLGVSGDGAFRFPFLSADDEFKGLKATSVVGGVTSEAGAEATQAYRYRFNGPTTMSEVEKEAFAKLLFAPVAETEAGVFRQLDNILMVKIFEPIYRQEDIYRQFRTARIGSLSLALAANAEGFSGQVDFIKDKSANPAGEGKPDEKENETRPLLKGAAKANGGVAFGYVKEEVLSQAASPDEPVQVTHSISFDGNYDWESKFDVALDKYKAQINAANTSPEVKRRGVQGLEWVEGKLKGQAGGKFSGGVVFSITSKVETPEGGTPIWTPVKLAVTFRGPKEFGVTDPDNRDEGDQYRLTFQIEGTERVDRAFLEVLGNMNAWSALMPIRQKARIDQMLETIALGRMPDAPDYDANNLYDQFLQFVRLTLNGGTWIEEVRKGRTVEKKLFEASLAAATGLDVGVAPFRFDQTMVYPKVKGITIGATMYRLEDYSALQYQLSTFDQVIGDLIEGKFGSLARLAYDKWREHSRKRAAQNAEGGEVGNDTATLETSTDADFEATEVGSFPFVTTPASSQRRPYHPADTEGPAERARYGIGGFHAFYSSTNTLSTPTVLRLSYSDGEVAGLDESSIGLYKWSDVLGDWQPVAGVLDAGANQVTTTITQLGLYTLGVRMPSGRITWTVDSVSRTGSGAGARTTVTLTSSVVANNDGSVVAPGTAFHVALDDQDVAAGSTVQTPDVDPLVEGTQVGLDSDGRLRVTLSLAGLRSSFDWVVFAEGGTANGSGPVILPVQP